PAVPGIRPPLQQLPPATREFQSASMAQQQTAGHCGCSNRCPRDDLLVSLMQFLRHDLASEPLSDRSRLAQRSLLDRLTAMELQEPGGAGRRCCCLGRCPAESLAEPPRLLGKVQPMPAATDRQARSPPSGASAVAAAAAVTRRDKKAATTAQRDARVRMSLPPQMFSIANNCSSPPPSEAANRDEVDYEEPWSPSRSNPIALPSKLAVNSRRRQSVAGWPASAAFAESWVAPSAASAASASAAAVSGPLQLRQSDSGRWVRFGHCTLQGSRLLCCRHQQRPIQTLQLAGYSAIYSDRESGICHVIKLAHASLPMHALAADSEAEACVWIAALNAACGTGGCGGHPPTNSVSAAAASFSPAWAAFRCSSSSSTSNSNDSYSGGGGGGGVAANGGPESQSPAAGIDHHRRGSLPPSLSSSLSFSPETSPVHHAAASAASGAAGEPAKSSKSPGEGLIRRFRGSFGAGSGGGSGDKSSASQGPPLASPDALVSGLVFAKLLPAALPSVTAASGQQPAVGHWCRRFAQLLPSSCVQLAEPDGSCEFRLPLAQLRIGPLRDDRKRRSALRLYSEADDRDWLLLDVTDKTRLGAWIKQLILATAPCYDTPALPSRSGAASGATSGSASGAASGAASGPTAPQRPLPPPPRRQLPDLPPSVATPGGGGGGGAGGLSLACLTDSQSRLMDSSAGPALKTRLLLQQGWAS
ncbi:hypothetical protein BOX15_Mlig029352g1, partial [Macrostomum lignano]